MTKDERLLLEIYKRTKSANGTEGVDPFAIGKSLGLSEHIIKNVLKGLIQANFLQRTQSEKVTLTSRGEDLVKMLQ